MQPRRGKRLCQGRDNWKMKRDRELRDLWIKTLITNAAGVQPEGDVMRRRWEPDRAHGHVKQNHLLSLFLYLNPHV